MGTLPIVERSIPMGVEYEFVVQRKQTVWYDTAHFQVSKCYGLAGLVHEHGPNSKHIRPNDTDVTWLIEEMDEKGMSFSAVMTGKDFLDLASRDFSKDNDPMRPWEIRWVNAIAGFIRAISTDESFSEIRVFMFHD